MDIEKHEYFEKKIQCEFTITTIISSHIAKKTPRSPRYAGV